jgi:UDP-N-acetylglucosamine 1-carboxyvinyltransferase
VSILRIAGGRRLSGRIEVGGNKNAALPLLAACLLTDQECRLHNVPQIRDVDVMVDLLRDLGAEVRRLNGTSLSVRCQLIRTDEPDPALVGRLRGSVLLLGPLLARNGSARLAPPGGDFPTRRRISAHLEALGRFGVQAHEELGHVLVAPDGLTGARAYLEEASVTGTETAILAAVAARGSTVLRHAACEPHVVELCEFLRKMGSAITGEGTSTVRIEGGGQLRGAEHTLSGDYIEAGSWGVVSAITRGEIEVRGARAEDMEVIASVLTRMRVGCTVEEGRFHVEPSHLAAVRRVTTGLWPGFPSDMISLVTVLATQADGRTLIHDWMYELRLFALEQLSGMGADLFLCDPHRIIATGPTRLRGRHLDSRDIRSGMALIAAALAAEGESEISSLETVERGYANVTERLRDLGAQVERVPAPAHQSGASP